MRGRVTLQEAQGYQIVLLSALSGADVVIRSQVFQDSEDPLETLFLVGPNPLLQQLEDVYLPQLLGKGDETYRWSGVLKGSSKTELRLWYKRLPGLPRVELLERVFRRDVATLANLCLSNVAELVVISPWGNIVQKQPVMRPIPEDQNGKIVLDNSGIT